MILHNFTPKELFTKLTDMYGKDWYAWEPETIWKEIELAKFYDLDTECVRSKIQAIQTIVSNDSFWKEWHVFEKICLAFNNITPKFDIIEDVSPAQMAYGMRMANEIRGSAYLPGKAPSYSVEVKIYIATRCYLDGLVYIPKPLDIAQKHLNEITQMPELAAHIEAYAMQIDAKIEENAVSIGAIKAKIISSYAYSDKRKEP